MVSSMILYHSLSPIPNTLIVVYVYVSRINVHVGGKSILKSIYFWSPRNIMGTPCIPRYLNTGILPDTVAICHDTSLPCNDVFYRIVSFLIPNPQHTTRCIRLCIKNQCECRWEVHLFLVSEKYHGGSSVSQYRYLTRYRICPHDTDIFHSNHVKYSPGPHKHGPTPDLSDDEEEPTCHETHTVTPFMITNFPTGHSGSIPILILLIRCVHQICLKRLDGWM
jgi:hypothetical protein